MAAVSLPARPFALSSRRDLLLFWLFILIAPLARPQAAEPSTVRVDILSLFHPRTLTLAANALTTQVRATPTALTLTTGPQTTQAPALTLPATTFTLTVPGKLTRTYTGALTISSHNGILTAILTLPTELAVASIVAAESAADAPLESLKTQAVASRSYLLANLRPQAESDSCDTTRCQFLRSPPLPTSPAAQATRATRNQVLTWRPSPEAAPTIVPAMYSRSCGGHTHAHPTGPGTYPFYPVGCDYCLRHPETWKRTAPAAATATESNRLAYNRTHGWSAIPSNTYTQAADGTLEGRGTGHGIGLCQLGAADLARRGQRYTTILAHFYPNTTLTTLP